MNNTTFYHRSVLLLESIEALNIKSDGTYVDATFGGGGHSREILKHLGKKGKLIVFDHDKDAWKNLPDDTRVILVKENFQYLKKFLRLHKENQVDGILADLGVSSFQFDTAERGFSIRYDAPLDMRMDERMDFTAKDLLKTYSEKQLHEIFEKYGEVRNAKTLAKNIVEKRNAYSINTIQEFKNVIEECIKGNPNRYLAQVFQALRIEVNQELEVLKTFLKQSAECLKPNGRLAVITFHSLEDRLVKKFIKSGTFEDHIEVDVFGKRTFNNPLKPMKDVLPTPEEIKENPRSRSARLRIAAMKNEQDGTK